MTETRPAGLLPQISRGLGVSAGLAGRLLTLYAVGSVVAAVPVIAATRGWNRGPLLLPAIGGLLVFNGVTALSTDYVLTSASRFVAEHGGGRGVGPAGYARRMVTPHVGVAAVVPAAGTAWTPLIYAGVLLWGLTFGGAPTLLQTAIADAGGESADVAQSMLVTIFNLAVAGGRALGGVLLERVGPDSFPWTLLPRPSSRTADDGARGSAAARVRRRTASRCQLSAERIMVFHQ